VLLSKAPSHVQVNIGCDFYLDGELDDEGLLLIDMGTMAVIPDSL